MRIPTRNGVGASRVSLPVGPWPTVLDFLSERMPNISHDEWLQRFAHGLVLNEEAQPVAATQAYTPHAKLYYYRHITNEPVLAEKARIVFEDDHVLVADKPHFMPARFIYVPTHSQPPLAAIEGLVQGCRTQASEGQRTGPGWFPNRAMPQRVEWMLELLERREHERLQRRSGKSRAA